LSRLDVRQPGVVDQHVDRPVRGFGAIDPRRAGARVAEIRLDRRAGHGELAHELLEQRLATRDER
jgi:hypothetical protein